MTIVSQHRQHCGYRNKAEPPDDLGSNFDTSISLFKEPSFAAAKPRANIGSLEAALSELHSEIQTR